MMLLDEYAFSLRVADNVINFISSAGESWNQPTHVLLFQNIFPKKKSPKVRLIITQIIEYNTLKKEIFLDLEGLIGAIQKDKDTPGIDTVDLINIRDAIEKVTEKIQESSEKFAFIQRIHLGDFVHNREIKKALFDFSNTETQLFISIRDEFYSIMKEWFHIHENELMELDRKISHGVHFGREVIDLQSKRLESYIKNLQKKL